MTTQPRTTSFRLEKDSIGSMKVPASAYYGVHSMRAKENFPITGRKLHPSFIRNLAFIKKAAAISNQTAGLLSSTLCHAICDACDEVINGSLREEFITDAIQGGAGTSANMNMNEVIANRAIEILGGIKGDYSLVHPNDHVNMSQSTNDVIPSAGKLTVLDLLQSLLWELGKLTESLDEKSVEFHDIIKMGRTQLQDAVPMRLGQSFHAYASMIRRDRERLHCVCREMYSLNLGATAIGSSINAPREYLDQIVPVLSRLSHYPLHQAADLFDATENLDGFVMVSSVLKACAMDLSKMCNDLRLLSSGPCTGISEIHLPARANGSSIMPGKVNPVIPEVVTQVAFRIAGNDTTIAMAAEAGQLELNAFEPVVFDSLFSSIDTLAQAVKTLRLNCICGITANREKCVSHLEHSVGIVTALSPSIGYEAAAHIAKEALKSQKTVREIVLHEQLLSPVLLDELLDPLSLVSPQKPCIQKKAV